jgi:serine O-acetyltransferase
MLALRLWRASKWCHRHGLRLPARALKAVIFLVFGALLEPEVELEGHVNLSHGGLGVVVHGSTVLGDWVRIWQYATIASNNDKNDSHKIVIGQGADIGAHALILCPTGRSLRIGAGAKIGAGAIVTGDVPARAVVLPEPSRVIADA